jgi:ribosomal protein S18 acetylase RimI-like enzyme
MTERITLQPFNQHDQDINKLAELYCRTFLRGDVSTTEAEEAKSNLLKHAGYKGFKGVKAVDVEGNLAGFAYGFTSLPGQFYRVKLEAQLSKELAYAWLSDCFEFVEMAVSPSFRRQGIAGKMHDRLIVSQSHQTSVLTTGMSNEGAIRFYEKKGWKVLKREAAVIGASNLQIIMGLKL